MAPQKLTLFNGRLVVLGKKAAHHFNGETVTSDARVSYALGAGRLVLFSEQDVTPGSVKRISGKYGAGNILLLPASKDVPMHVRCNGLIKGFGIASKKKLEAIVKEIWPDALFFMNADTEGPTEADFADAKDKLARAQEQRKETMLVTA